MDTEAKNELLLNTVVSLLMELKAYQLFLDWIKNKAGPHSEEIEGILIQSRREVASDQDLQSRLRGIAEDALQRGEDNLSQHLQAFLRSWNPKGKAN
jgi:hypothetical protein